MKDITKRDSTIDDLRFIALVGILFAHVNSPNWLMELRSFDVILMIILMGNSYYLSSINKKRLQNIYH